MSPMYAVCNQRDDQAYLVLLYDSLEDACLGKRSWKAAGSITPINHPRAPWPCKESRPCRPGIACGN